MRFLIRAATLATLAAAGVFAPPAGAAVSRNFDLWTGTAYTRGQAHVYGTATFRNNGSVEVAGWINDVCPQDGYGATVRFLDSVSSVVYGAASDHRGCGYAAKPFSFIAYHPQGQTILSLRIDLREYSADTGNYADSAAGRVAKNG